MIRIGQVLIDPHFAKLCSSTSKTIFLPTWYEYLQCNSGSPQFNSIADVWLVVAAIIEILLRIAALAAVGMMIYAGIQYAISSGEPDKTQKALQTIINAAIGLAICILSAAIVTFIAGRF